ncbi:MAG TPA: phosphatase PAP2 family protein [Anaerolineales bacterium]|nr:phosphatase PAP2 family protein [Anaerolineales bacterium]
MFQTELILHLQSLASDGLTAFMNAITTLGDDKISAVILLIIALGVSFRRGMPLIQIFMWTLLLTHGLKEFFGLPRPTFVHSGIQDLQHNIPNTSPFSSTGSETFLGPIDPQVVSAFRLQGNEDCGFPSGHVSSIVAVWGGIALLFRKRIFYWVAPILIVLVALSRMYLGWHFLGDVLGGAAVSAVVLAIAYLFLARWGFDRELFERINFEFMPKIYNALLYVLLLGVPLVLGILSADALGKGAGYLVGANTALILIVMKRRTPDDNAPPLQRLVRTSLGLLFYFGAYGLAELILEPTGLESIAFIDVFIKSAVLIFVSIHGAYSVSDRLIAKA